MKFGDISFLLPWVVLSENKWLCCRCGFISIICCLARSLTSIHFLELLYLTYFLFFDFDGCTRVNMEVVSVFLAA